MYVLVVDGSKMDCDGQTDVFGPYATVAAATEAAARWVEAGWGDETDELNQSTDRYHDAVGIVEFWREHPEQASEEFPDGQVLFVTELSRI